MRDGCPAGLDEHEGERTETPRSSGRYCPNPGWPLMAVDLRRAPSQPPAPTRAAIVAPPSSHQANGGMEVRASSHNRSARRAGSWASKAATYRSSRSRWSGRSGRGRRSRRAGVAPTSPGRAGGRCWPPPASSRACRRSPPRRSTGRRAAGGSRAGAGGRCCSAATKARRTFSRCAATSPGSPATTRPASGIGSTKRSGGSGIPGRRRGRPRDRGRRTAPAGARCGAGRDRWSSRSGTATGGGPPGRGRTARGGGTPAGWSPARRPRRPPRTRACGSSAPGGGRRSASSSSAVGGATPSVQHVRGPRGDPRLPPTGPRARPRPGHNLPHVPLAVAPPPGPPPHGHTTHPRPGQNLPHVPR